MGILVILFLLIPTLATADGMAFSYRDGGASSLEPMAVDEQRAVIAHKDGVQRMFIARSISRTSHLLMIPHARVYGSSRFPVLRIVWMWR